jgi:DNA polymerase-3 subunit delta'
MPVRNDIYPWQQQPWQHFLAYRQSGRLPHALLLSGVKGLGKANFAKQIARIVLCKNAKMTGELCQSCYSCLLEDITEHPDFYSLAPDAEGQAIKIESVRELIVELQSTSHYHGYRIVQISPAENMNMASANALLKTLEEPGDDILFILMTSAIGRLPATLRSRCQMLHFSPDFSDATQKWLIDAADCNKETAQQLLAQAEGAPLQALHLAQDKQSQQQQQILLTDLIALTQSHTSPLVIAQRWHELGGTIFIDQLLTLLNQLLWLKANNKQREDLNTLLFRTQHISLRQWIDYTNEILQIRTRYIKSPNLNLQLLVESILIKLSVAWMER